MPKPLNSLEKLCQCHDAIEKFFLRQIPYIIFWGNPKISDKKAFKLYFSILVCAGMVV